MRAELLWQQALNVSEQAFRQGALVPLSTQESQWPGLAPFRLRQLISAVPRHLRGGAAPSNPFLPWDHPLEVQRLESGHVLLLNKYPVQPGHLLVITDHWQPQHGWLDRRDWQAVARVSADTGGLWFFNSCAAAGASQQHRHLQLLPRHPGQQSCPLAPLIQEQLQLGQKHWPWAYRLSRRRDACGGSDLAEIYGAHCASLGLGTVGQGAPAHPYNLLFDDDWFLTVRREREHQAGFSINALGFAGCLLSTGRSDLEWLRSHGPWQLLASVAARENDCAHDEVAQIP